MTDGASLPNKESQEQRAIKSIKERLEKMPQFSKKCTDEADNSSQRKRNNRWYQVVIGGGTELLGFLGTVFSDGNVPFSDIPIGKVVGALTIATGSVVASISEYIDPKKSRQRAIDLRNIAIKIDNLAEEKQIEYLGLKDDPRTNLTQLVELDKTLRDSFTDLQKEAWNNGVDV